MGDNFVGRDGQPIRILAIWLDPTPTTVYNLEVDGTYTYFAEGVWVHNNSCPLGRQLLFHIHHALPKFLGGADDGLKLILDETLHSKYHGGLLSRLGKLGRKSNHKWEDFFRTNPGAQEKALDILIDYTTEFDQTHGTDLLPYIWKQISSQ